jgi:hypothetical protein
MTATSSSESARIEAERQLTASMERHREVVASMEEAGRPEAGQHVAVKSVGRAVQLVSFSLKRAAAVGIPFERLVELTGWEPELVRAGLEQTVPKPWFMARLAPAGIDAQSAVQAAAAFEAITRLQRLTERILADVDEPGASPPPARADLDDLYERLESTWRSWRQGLAPPDDAEGSGS